MTGPSRTRTVLAPTLAIAVALGALDAQAARALRFRHGLLPDTRYAVSSEMSIRIVADMGALEGETAADPESGDAASLGMRQELTMRSILKVGAETPEGDLPLECSIEGLSGTIELAGQKFEIPGVPDEVLAAAGFRGRLIRGGREVQVETTGLDALPPDTRQMLSQVLQILPTFPERKLKVGDSFENPVDFELPGLPTGVDLDTRGSITYTLTAIEAARALFDTRAELSAHAFDGPGEARSTSITGTLTGTAVFDRALGVFTSQNATLTMDLSMELEVPGRPAGDPSAASPPTTTRVRATASGPVEIRLTPEAVTTPPGSSE